MRRTVTGFATQPARSTPVLVVMVWLLMPQVRASVSIAVGVLLSPRVPSTLPLQTAAMLRHCMAGPCAATNDSSVHNVSTLWRDPLASADNQPAVEVLIDSDDVMCDGDTRACTSYDPDPAVPIRVHVQLMAQLSWALRRDTGLQQDLRTLGYHVTAVHTDSALHLSSTNVREGVMHAFAVTSRS